MEQIIKKHSVVAILRRTPSKDLRDYTASLYAGGLRCFEVSFSEEGAKDQLAWMKVNMPADTCIGAGTILTAHQARQAEEAGADFMLSPSVSPEVLEYCAKQGIPFLPGVFTPTDVSVCVEYGCNVMKLFPASSLPLSHCKALQGPFPGTKYVAVGGVTPQNADTYLKTGYAGVGIGSALVNKERFEKKDWAGIASDVEQFLQSLKKEGLR